MSIEPEVDGIFAITVEDEDGQEFSFMISREQAVEMFEALQGYFEETKEDGN